MVSDRKEVGKGRRVRHTYIGNCTGNTYVHYYMHNNNINIKSEFKVQSSLGERDAGLNILGKVHQILLPLVTSESTSCRLCC